MLRLTSLTILFSLCLAVAAPGSEEYDLWKKGKSFWYKEQWMKAAETYQKLVDKYPESPRRCKSIFFIGYCYYEMGNLDKSFDVFSKLVSDSSCRKETIVDAQTKRLLIAFKQAKKNPTMKRVLIEALKDEDPDIRLLGAAHLGDLDDPTGMKIFFQTLQTDSDPDRRDIASKYILKLGSGADKQRHTQILEEFRKNQPGKAPKMIQFTITDLATKTVKVRLRIPIKLVNVIRRSLSPEHLKMIEEEANIDLTNPGFDLSTIPAGKEIFKIIDGDQREVRLWVE